MAAPRRLVLASDNPGKQREFATLLGAQGFEVLTQAMLGIDAAPEPYPAFVDNALAKARHAARRSGLPALADDSGLCCRALDGAPGVRSARFAGEGAGDTANNALLLKRLAGASDRSAHYVCVLVALRHADDPEPVIADARWDGEIALAERGAHGFGYDPLFWLPELGCTAAELAPERKNRVSHRAQAMAELARKLALRWT